MSSPFFHYNSSFDAEVVMRTHAVPNLESNAAYLTNFLGMLIDPKFFPQILADRAGQVEPIHEEFPMISLEKASSTCSRVDLLHIDIQGDEADLIRGLLSFLNQKVAYMTVGTHSREIEGKIFESLRASGWWLEIEGPAILSISNGVPLVTVDGVQGRRNPALLPIY